MFCLHFLYIRMFTIFGEHVFSSALFIISFIRSTICSWFSFTSKGLKIRSKFDLDALGEVLGNTTFSIYLVFQFEWYTNLSDIPILVTFQFEWHFNLSEVPNEVTFQFEWHSVLSDIPFWLILHFEWHSILSDTQFWVTLNFEWH